MNKLNLTSLKEKGYVKVWGEHSLTIGEIVGGILAFLVYKFGAKLFGKYSKYVALAILIVAMALF